MKHLLTYATVVFVGLSGGQCGAKPETKQPEETINTRGVGKLFCVRWPTSAWDCSASATLGGNDYEAAGDTIEEAASAAADRMRNAIEAGCEE